MKKYSIINNSTHINPDFLEFLLRFICKGISKKLPRFTAEFTNFAFTEDKRGNRTYSEDELWDGTAYSDGRVEVVAHANLEYPTLICINPLLKGKYLKNTYIANLEELLVWITSHEIFHLYQWNNPNELGLGKQFGADDETSADLFATITLNKWRRTFYGQ